MENQVKRVKVPRYLAPLDVSKRQRAESTGKVAADQQENQQQTELSPKCSQCLHGKTGLDDSLSENERKQLQCISNIGDPYQWTNVQDLPAVVKDPIDESAEEIHLTSQDRDHLVVVGVALKPKADEFGGLDNVVNLKVAKCGLSFEVASDESNEASEKELPKRASPLAKYDIQAYARPSTGKASAQQIENKLRNAELRRRSRLVDRSAQCKAMVGRNRQRIQQIERLVKERHDSGIRRIVKQIDLAADRRDKFYARSNERCRLRNARIAELLELRRTRLDNLGKFESTAEVTGADSFQSKGETGSGGIRKFEPLNLEKAERSNTISPPDGSTDQSPNSLPTTPLAAGDSKDSS